MTSDEHIAQSVNVGHEVARRLKEKFGRIRPQVLAEIQHQAELAYMTAVRDVHLDLAARYPKDAVEA